MRKFTLQIVFFSCVLVLFACAANANPVDVQSTILDGQDLDPINGWVEELGNQFDHILDLPFPDDEWIDSSWVETTEYACSLGSDNPAIPNVLVSITNRTNLSFTDLWYVADPETTFSNYDKERINGQLAFKIDRVGFNQPLITIDFVFNPGDTWSFIIEDYVNALCLPPSAFASLGVPSIGDFSSSGSIIPEPCTIALLAFGALALRRKK